MGLHASGTLICMSTVQGSLSSHEGQSPSQTSPGSVMPLPHRGGGALVQSLSVLEFSPSGQQRSPGAGAVIGTAMQVTLQPEPRNTWRMQSLGSGHDVGHGTSGGSQVSPLFIMPSPHLGGMGMQSLSLLELAPFGQQPSSFAGVVIGRP